MTASRDVTATEPLSTRRQLELMRDLQRLANERSQEESRIRTALDEGLQVAEIARDTAAADIARQFDERRAQAAAEYEQVTSEARTRYESEREAAQQEYKGLRQGVESEVSRATKTAHDEKQRVSFEALTVFDALKGRPRERFLDAVRRLELTNQELVILEHDAIEIMKMRRQWREFPAVESTDVQEISNSLVEVDAVEQAIQRAADSTSAVRDAALALHRQKLTRWFEGARPFGMFLLVWALAAGLSALLPGWHVWQSIAASGAVAIVTTVVLLAWFWPIAGRESGRQFQAIQQLLANARKALRHALEEARARGQREAQALISNRDQQLTAVE